MKFHSNVVLAALLACGCTTTPAKVYDKPVSLTVESSKSPSAFAACIADHITGGDVRDEGSGRFAVVRSNGYGAIGRWDIYPTARGSRAEWRRVSELTTGAGAARECV